MESKDVIYKKYQDIFDFTEGVIEKTPGIFSGQKDDTLEKQITIYHLARANYLLDATKILCNQGYVIEALVLIRSLVNLYINLKWLTSGDSSQRMERYADFEVIFKKKKFEIGKKYSRHKEKNQKINSFPHENSFKEVINKYGLKSNIIKGPIQWSGKSIYQMAKDVGLTLDYELIYSQLSSIEHTCPSSAREYLGKIPEGNTILNIGPRDKDISGEMLTAIDYLFKVREVALKVFDLDFEERSKEIEEFNKLQEKYLVR